MTGDAAREEDDTPCERPPLDPMRRRDEDEVPTPEEALDSLLRFIHSHFRNRLKEGDETARFSIPANPRRDDDLRLSAFIRYAGRLHRAAVALRDAPIVDEHNSTATYVRAERELRAVLAERD